MQPKACTQHFWMVNRNFACKTGLFSILNKERKQLVLGLWDGFLDFAPSFVTTSLQMDLAEVFRKRDEDLYITGPHTILQSQETSLCTQTMGSSFLGYSWYIILTLKRIYREVFLHVSQTMMFQTIHCTSLVHSFIFFPKCLTPSLCFLSSSFIEKLLLTFILCSLWDKPHTTLCDSYCLPVLSPWPFGHLVPLFLNSRIPPSCHRCCLVHFQFVWAIFTEERNWVQSWGLPIHWKKKE